MKQINRRQFLRLAAASIISATLAACQQALPGATEEPDVTPVPPPSAPDGTPAQAAARVLVSLNRPRYNVRFLGRTPVLDHAAWRLQIEGVQQGPTLLSFAEMVETLAVTRQNSRLVCVEGWSFRADWEGFTLQALLDVVQPVPQAKYLRFEAVDGYYEVLSIEELLADRMLFAYKMDGEYLSDEHGWPLRLIMPDRYGYKGAKSITRLIFTDKAGKGYWSTVGPYTVAGMIEPGIDRPQDMPGERRQTVEGEQSY